MSGNKCRSCGSTNIETDPGRGDAICTACGVVFEEQIIVSEQTFEESPLGNIMVLGQFVSNESSGGATGFGGGYMVNGKESREITIQNARKGITHLCHQLRLNNHHIDTSVTFYKMALSRNLTRGRKQAHNHAACVYITCRTEGTAHMLIDISDVLQICVHELGRTYLKFAQALCIKIPSVDPCLYIMRFANKLEFGSKTHEIYTTAMRVVQRMMRDSIHSGRRPAGLCGAALLMAARLHEFNRSPADIIKVVKVHESTLRKRLIEFGETPSSALTLDEFMTVDLEEEQDPPAFKAARKKDREMIRKMENIDTELNELQSEINKQLEIHKITKVKKCDIPSEEVNAEKFIMETSMDTIRNCISGNPDQPSAEVAHNLSNNTEISALQGLGPDVSTMGLNASSRKDESAKEKSDSIFENETGEIVISDLDDEELDSYIMTDKEAQFKSVLWHQINEKYLEEQKEKEEKRKREKEEGKPEKKRKRPKKSSARNQPSANSAGEAIEKMLQEKRLSNKINYDVLKNLNVKESDPVQEKRTSESSTTPRRNSETNIEFHPTPQMKIPSPMKRTESMRKQPVVRVGVKRKMRDEEEEPEAKKSNSEPVSPSVAAVIEAENDSEVEKELVDESEDYVDEDIDDEPTEMSVGQVLGHYGGNDDDYDYDEDEY